MKHIQYSLLVICVIFFKLTAIFGQFNNNSIDLPVKKTIGFQENKGQFNDTEGISAPYVLFKVEDNGMIIWVTTKGITYQFIEGEEEKEKSEASFDIKKKPSPEKIKWHRVDMILRDASIKKENITTINDITQGQINYLTSKYSIYGVKTYSKILIKNIYKGIDWVLYINTSTGALKHDFIVHPYADSKQIKIVYEGSGSIDVSNNQIKLKNRAGELVEGELYCYNKLNNSKVKANYNVIKNTSILNLGPGIVKELKINDSPEFSPIFSSQVTIDITEYNRADTLIIDPQLVWASYFGGSGSDGPMDIETDNQGNLFVCGYNGGANFPIKNLLGAYNHTSVNGGAFISRFSNTGHLNWSTHLSEFITGTDLSANAMCIGSNGNVFITGKANSNFPLFNTGAFFQGSIGSSQDAFIMSFNNNGAALWATFYGGNSDDEGNDIFSDALGNIYVIGNTKSNNFPEMQWGTAYHQANNNGLQDAFILKFTNTGARQWATCFGGSQNDFGFSGSIDVFGNIIVCGTTNSPGLPITNTVSGSFSQAILAGQEDGFLLRFQSNGTLDWGSYFGGGSTDYLISVACDSKGNFFAFGFSSSTVGFPITNYPGSYFQPVNNGATDAVILKMNSSLNLIWSTYYGGAMLEGTNFYGSGSHNLFVDKCDNLYCSITTGSFNIPTVSSCDAGYNDASFEGIDPFKTDILISKFNNNGKILWSTYFGGDAKDFRESIHLDKQGNLYIIGEWLSYSNKSTYPFVDPGGTTYFSDVPFGGEDGYIAKFKVATLSTSVVTSNSFCKCNGKVSANVTGGCNPYTYNWYNSSWQLIGTKDNKDSLCAGSYILVVSDSITCATPDTVTFSIAANGTNVSVSQNKSFCTGYSHTLPGGTIVSTPGTYYDTLVMKNGCDSMITINLTEKPNSFSILSVTLCAGESYTLPSGTVVTESGVYRDTLKSKNGCDSIHTVSLTINDAPLANLPSDITINNGQSVTMTGVGYGTYSWTPSAGLSDSTTLQVIATPTVTTTYCLIITNPNGCIDTGCITIHVEVPCPTQKEHIQLPNAFSPNNDGVNDEFCLQNTYGCLVNFSITIFDRWGEKVFASKDPNFCWDGIYKGNVLSSQVFVYSIIANYSNLKKPLEVNGNISLIR